MSAQRAKRGKREQQRLFQLENQWITQEEGRSSYYRAWLEGRRVRRKSLGTDDFEEAKRKLAQEVLAEPPDDPYAPEHVLLASVFAFYLNGHVPSIRSQSAARRACSYCQDFMERITKPNPPTVADLTLVQQHSFMRWLASRGLSAKSISTYMSTIKAAMNYGAKPRIVMDSTGREREARMLSAPHYITDSQTEVCKITGMAPPKPREFLPTVQQMGAFIDAIPERYDHIFRYTIIALNTWARPEAIFDLDVSEQVDFQNGLIDLLPPGKQPQKNKRRPTIRLTDNLRGWLLHWNDAKPIRFQGKPASSIHHRTFRKIAYEAGIPEFVAYGVRHFQATRVRRVSGWTVTREERAQWLGHVDRGHRQTEWYEKHDPDYLENVAGAIDAIMTELDQHTARSLWAPGSVAGGRLTVVGAYRLGRQGGEASDTGTERG